jgi:hypothetical protein
MKRILLATAVVAALGAPLLPTTAIAATCAETGFVRDGINLTAAQIGGNVTGTIDAADTGGAPCNIGVYYGPGTTGSVSGATIENANYFGVVNNGGNVTVSGSTVTHIGEMPLDGTQHGNAIFFASDGGTSTGVIRSNTVTHYQKGGIVLNGASASATITGNTVVGEGPISYTAQNGIEVLRGAKATVKGNFVSNNAYTGVGNTSASGILVFGGAAFGSPNTTGVMISKNTVTNNDVGVWLFNASDCSTVCVASTTATKETVKFNTISNAAVTNTTGYSVAPDCGYQAGVADLGKNDGIVNNSISGTGYTKQAGGDCTGTPPAFLRFIDVSAKAHGVPSNK